MFFWPILAAGAFAVHRLTQKAGKTMDHFTNAGTHSMSDVSQKAISLIDSIDSKIDHTVQGFLMFLNSLENQSQKVLQQVDGVVSEAGLTAKLANHLLEHIIILNAIIAPIIIFLCLICVHKGFNYLSKNSSLS